MIAPTNVQQPIAVCGPPEYDEFTRDGAGNTEPLDSAISRSISVIRPQEPDGIHLPSAVATSAMRCHWYRALVGSSVDRPDVNQQGDVQPRSRTSAEACDGDQAIARRAAQRQDVCPNDAKL